MATKCDREQREIRYSSARETAAKQERGFSATTVKLPEGIGFFTTKKPGEYKIDIIPYIAGKGNPHVDEGFAHYERMYFAHRNIGPENNTYVCLAKTFKKRCPICEERDRLQREGGSEELIKALKPQQRHLWRIIDRTDDDKKIQIWDTGYFRSFGQMLDEETESNEEYDQFHRLDEQGFTLRLRVKEETFNGRKFGAVKKLDFLPRKNPLNPKLIDAEPNLDEILVEMDYAELKKIFLQTGGDSSDEEDEDEDEDESPKTQKGKKEKPSRDEDDDDEEEPEDDDDEEEPEDDDDEEDEKPKAKSSRNGKKEPTAGMYGLKEGDEIEHKKWGTCTITKISKDGTSITLEDEDEEEHRAVAPAECKKAKPEDDDSDEGEEEAPKKKGRTPAKSQDDDEDDGWDDEDDDEEEDEDDEPPAKKKGTRKAKASDDDDEEEPEDDDSDDDDWDDDDEEDEPPAKKKPTAKKRK